MEIVRRLLEQQPMMALFLTIAIGYLVGQVNIRRFSIGIGAVLFVALVVGWFAPNSVPATAVGTLGLALYLYALGIQYGKEFFRGFSSSNGRKANLLALIGVLSAGATSLACVRGKVTLGHALGLFAGSGTNTPTLQAAIQTLGNNEPAMGYSVAYPIGVAGPILLLFLAFRILKPRIEIRSVDGLELLEISVCNPRVFGKRLGELLPNLPAGVQIACVRRADRNQPALPELIIEEGNILLCVSSNKAALEQSRELFGEASIGSIVEDRRDLDYLLVFVSRPGVVGSRLGDLVFPKNIQSLVTHVRRGDADLLGRSDLILEFGDRIGVLTHRGNFPDIRKFFGNSIKSTSEFSYVSIGLGMAIGFLVGAFPFQIPGIGMITIGLSGVLIIGLVLGKLRHTGSMNWTIPMSANLVLRNLGLTLFLVQVGMASGPMFAVTVAETGFLFLGLSSIILMALVLPILLIGLYVFRMPFDEVAGIVSAACGKPAILSFTNQLAPTDRPDITYAMIFPGMTIVKILFVDIIPTFY